MVAKMKKGFVVIALISLMLILVLNPDVMSSVLNSGTVIPSSGTIKKTITWLHTENGYIKNEYGEVVQLTGVGIQEFMAGRRIGYSVPADENGSTQNRATVASYFKKIKDAGANHVRISIKLLQKWCNPVDYSDYIPNLDMCVEETAKLNLYIYFCFHYGSHSDDGLMQALIDNSAWGAWNNSRDDWLSTAKEIAYRYRNYKNVMGYQNQAEPGWARFGRDYLNMEGNSTVYAILCQEWASFNLDVARAIHSVNPNALVFVSSPGYYARKNVCDYYYNNPLNETNIVYAWQDYHCYQTNQPFWKSYGAGNYTLAEQQQENWLTSIAFRMSNKGYPVHLVEFGFTKDFTEISFERQMTQDMYDIFSGHKQGWSQFCWGSGNSQWYLLYDDGNLTESGQLMKQNFTPLP